jgi:hypothetical protein
MASQRMNGKSEDEWQVRVQWCLTLNPFSSHQSSVLFFFLTNFNTRTYIIGVGNSWQKMRNSLQVSQKRLMLHHSAGSDGS